MSLCFKDNACALQLQGLQALWIKSKIQFNWISISTIVICTIVLILYDRGIKVAI